MISWMIGKKAKLFIKKNIFFLKKVQQSLTHQFFQTFIENWEKRDWTIIAQRELWIFFIDWYYIC